MNKLFSIFLSLLMVFQSILPGFYFAVNPSVVSAQEATSSTEAVESTPSPTTEPTSPPEVSPIPSASPFFDPTPSSSDDVNVSPPPSAEVSPAPSVEQTPNESPNPPPAEQNNQDSVNQSTVPIEIQQPAKGHLSAEILHIDNTNSLQLDLDATNSINSASLTTDKSDYAPTDVAVISGTDFPKEANLKLIITADNYRFETDVKIDANGSFTYFYQLDGTYRPLYNVEVQDLNSQVLATTSFTDSAPNTWPNCNFHCAAKDVEMTSLQLVDHNTGLPINSCTTGQQVNVDLLGSFDNNANSARSAVVVLGDLFQGNTLLEHLETQTGSGPIDGICGTDTIAAGGTQVSTLVNFNWTCGENVTLQNVIVSWDSPGNTCSAFFNAPQCSNRASKCNPASSFTVTGPGTLVVHKTFTDGHTNQGITINITGTTNMSVATNPNGDATFVPGNGTYTAHATEPAGYFESANTCVNVTVVSGQITNCNITDSPTVGTLVVHKIFTDQHSNSGITINVNPGNLSQVTNGSGDAIFSNLTPGTYSATVVEPSGYFQSVTTCTNVPVTAGQTTNCTITDSPILGTITVHKTIVGGSATPSQFCFTLSPDPGIGQKCADNITGNAVFNNVPAGTYSATESASASGYTQTANDCSAMVIASNGDSNSCTVTNTRDIGSIVVHKLVDTDGNGTYETTDSGANTLGFRWSLDGSGSNNMGSTVSGINTGTHSVNENSVTDYHFVSWYLTADTSKTCANSNNLSLPVSISVTKNQITDITLCNAHDIGTIKVVKDVVPNDNGVTGWDFSISGPTNNSVSNLHDGNSSSAFNSLTGSYTASESAHIGTNGNDYDTSYVCTDGSSTLASDSGTITTSFNLASNKNVVCTFTNAIKRGTIIVEKQTNPDGDQAQFSFSGDASGAISDNGQIVISNLLPGNYTSEELVPQGWDLTNISCDDRDSNGNLQTHIATFNVSAGEVVKCIFTNTKRGHLIVEKTTIPGGELTQFPIEATGSGVITGNGSGVITDALDQMYEVTPGVYSVTEFTPDGWNQTGNSCQEVEVNAGETASCTFTNTIKGQVVGSKFHDLNGNGIRDEEEGGLEDWTIFIDENENGELDGEEVSTQTDEDGNYVLPNLGPGPHSICEQEQPGWLRTKPVQNNCEQVSIENSNQTSIVDFGNQARGTITINKNVDTNGDGDLDDEGDVLGATNWTWDIENGEQDISTDESRTLSVGSYTVSEDQQAGYQLVDWSCSNEERGTTNLIEVNITLNSQIVCTFTNKPLPAVLTITKTNDKNGADTSPGSSVLYTITLTLTGNSLNNVVVTDLLPDGFTYQGGSFTANSSIHGSLTIEEPTYHSPGVWSLGSMSAGETITLTSLSNINGSIDPGLYKDLAWAKGTGSGSTVLANADSGIFIGSEVNVNTNPNGTNYDVERKETGEILGISTSLPSTGVNSRWIMLAGVLMIAGLLSLGAGLAWRKKMKSKFLSLIITLLFAVIFVPAVLANSLSIRLEQPKSPNNDNDFNITFVTLNTENQPTTVKCFKKGPSEGGFSEFGSDISLQAGGNTGNCHVSSSVIGSSGTYQFYVTADAGSDSATSDTVSVSYKTDAPGTPYNYSKEKIGSCEYKIKFKTAADSGRTHKIEIYMSSLNTFSADAGTKVGEVGIGSDQEGSFQTSVPDCNKTYYFAIRAFDDAGNGSGVVGDNFTTVTTTTVTTSPAPGGAIPVASSQVSQGSILGVGRETEATSEGEILGEGTPSASPAESSSEETAGASTSNLFSAKNLLFAAIMAAIVGAGIYFFRKNKP